MNNFKDRIIFKGSASLFILFLSLFSLTSLVSCFTGIESTKKINLSREDKKRNTPTPEELFMSQIQGSPLSDWQRGKRFIVSDNKALLVIVPQEGLLPVAPDSIKGKILEFEGVQSKINAAGELTVTIVFSDGIFLYTYNTGKEFDEAMVNVKSDQIPMLIDEEMVTAARGLLKGKKFWSKSSLWYNEQGERIDGLKYSEVIVEDVFPGNYIFPLWLKLKAEDNKNAFLYMNFGSADNESRAFANLFSLSDIRKQYPGIEPETWNLISRGEVKEGMTKDEVRLALGNPRDLTSGHDYSQTLDIWRYENGKVIWFEDGRIVRIRQ